MRHYRDQSGRVYAFESDEEKQAQRPDLTPLTAEDLAALLAPHHLTIEERVAAKLAERGLPLDGEWQLYSGIAGMLALGALQGKTPEQLYATNTGYRNAMDLHAAITAIRSN